MTYKIKKIWKFVVILFKADLSWKEPDKSKILIFDSTGLNAFIKYFEKWNPQVLHVRGEKINLKILLNIMIKPGRIQESYISEYITRVDPELIVTYIDNSKYFYTLSNKHKSRKTLFIQNGLRSYYGDIFDSLDSLKYKDLVNLKVDYILTFGNNIGDYFLKYISGLVFPVGSIINNSVEKNNKTQKGLMAFISQLPLHDISVNGEMYDVEKFAGRVDRPIINFLEKYAELNNKKFKIIPRFPKKSKNRNHEEEYYRNLLNNKVEFFDIDKNFASYHACDIAEVVVAVDTTLAYESIARGNKTAVFSTRGSIFGLKGYDYGWPNKYPDQGPFWTNKSDVDSFAETLDYLFNIDESTWKDDLVRTNFSTIMEYDKGNMNFQKIINRIIDKKL